MNTHLHLVPPLGSLVPDEEAEPTATELAAIEAELPAIEAEVELLGVEIALLDRPVTELDARRLRRAAARAQNLLRDLTNRTNIRSWQDGGVA
ncbi:DUF6284 family protein [Streptomyces sp. WMMC897]|uniref:DUF6284 family protein n=1 Tax=Streptomyces sp. WMMC897 TaxID=3014782 RepID=UPI0022B74757|nr:DUF6284 family protein [Streptomyces sp. WMMC897]MCZ7417568.1 DUF6284 family protein [Streptomyces sp. WMMC897]